MDHVKVWVIYDVKDRRYYGPKGKWVDRLERAELYQDRRIADLLSKNCENLRTLEFRLVPADDLK